MPSIVDLAELCHAVYTLEPTVIVHPQDSCSVDSRIWRRGRRWDPWYSGFTAAVYSLDNENTVLAFAGTDSLWDWVADNRPIAAGGMPPQAHEAIHVAHGCGKHSNLYLTGHSLGGALAIIAAAHVERPAVSFNAPGVMDSCLVSSLTAPLTSFFGTVGRCFTGSRIMNVRIAGDPVSSRFITGAQTGASKQTYAGNACGLDLLCRHAMETVVQEVRAVPENFDPLDL